MTVVEVDCAARARTVLPPVSFRELGRVGGLQLCRDPVAPFELPPCGLSAAVRPRPWLGEVALVSIVRVVKRGGRNQLGGDGVSSTELQLVGVLGSLGQSPLGLAEAADGTALLVEGKQLRANN